MSCRDEHMCTVLGELTCGGLTLSRDNGCLCKARGRWDSGPVAWLGPRDNISNFTLISL